MARSNGRPPPHNVEAEASLLGALLLSPQAIADVEELGICPDDFYKPAHQFIYDAIRTLTRAGLPVDAVAVAEELRRGGVLDDIGGAGLLMDLQTDTPAISHARRYADIVRRTSLLRNVIGMAGELAEMAYDEPDDTAKLLSILTDARNLIETDDPAFGASLPDDFFSYMDLDERVAARQGEKGDWIIPMVLRRRWRALLVAPEGSAKSTIFRQIVLMCAVGRHPFLPDWRTKPCRTLTIDVENPLEIVQHQFELINKVADLGDLGDKAMIWAREEGLDLRKRHDQGLMENVIASAKPDLVTIGPLYKLGLRDGDDWDEVAAQLQGFLDKMRVKYDFALLIEHHPPQATSDGKRQIRPFGSSAWLRWPEFGLRFVPTEVDSQRQPTVLAVDHWRPPRLNDAIWPFKLKRSERGAPWIGEWPNGTFKDPITGVPEA